MRPLVSVLMPFYNAAPYLGQAIDSILAQSYPHWELLLLDDGSTDEGPRIAASYPDPRIRHLGHARQQGYTPLLNQGLALAQGQYIARMDADDLAHPERLARQVAFMESHPAHGLCGTNLAYIDAHGQPLDMQPMPLYTQHHALRMSLLLHCYICHPSVMMRTQTLRQHGLQYQSQWEPGEDYLLWTDLAEVCHIANLPEVLLYYRRHPQQVSQRRNHAQDAAVMHNYRRQLAALGLQASPYQLALHFSLSGYYELAAPHYGRHLRQWVQALTAQNRTHQRYPAAEFESFMNARLAEALQRHNRLVRGLSGRAKLRFAAQWLGQTLGLAKPKTEW